MGLFQSGLDENQKPNCPNRCPNWWPKGHDHRVPSRPAYAPGPQQAPHPHTHPSHTTTTEQRRGRPLHTLPSGRFPPSALPDQRTFVSWERSRFRSLGVSTLARDLSVRPGMLTHEAHEKALRNAYTSRCTPRPKRLHQPRQDSDAHSSVHGNTPEDPSGSRQATIHPARTPRGRSSVPSLVAPRRTCGVLGSWNHAAH